MVSLPDLNCILCVLCCFIFLCNGTFYVLLYPFSVLLYSSVLCAVHCYLFFSVLLLVMYVYLIVHIVLKHCHRVHTQSQLMNS
jgi:hypothetical protein